MNVESNKYQLIPAGDSKQEIKARELIISEVFRKWYEANPSKSIYNQNLRDNIYIFVFCQLMRRFTMLQDPIIQHWLF